MNAMIDAERRKRITRRLRQYSRIAVALREKVIALEFKEKLTHHIETFNDLERMFLSVDKDSYRPEDVETMVLDHVELLARIALVSIRDVQEHVASDGYDVKIES